MTEGDRPRPAGSSRDADRAALAVAVLVVVATTMWWGQSGFFFLDAWDWIAEREFRNPEDWVRRHQSHWTATQFVLVRGTYLVAGLDWWPAYPAALAAVLAGCVLGLDWAMRLRGLAPRLAAAAAGGTTMLWTLDQPEHVARAIGVTAVVVIASAMGRDGPRARVAVVVWGLLGVTSGPAAVIASAIAAAVGVAHGPWRRDGWWWPPLVPLAAYVVWRLGWGPPSGDLAATASAGDLLRVLDYVVGVARGALGVDGPVAAAAAVALVALVSLAVARRSVDATGRLVLAAVAGLAVVSLGLRGHHDFARFGTQVVPLLLLAVVVGLPARLQRLTVVVLVVAGLLRVAGPPASVRELVDERREQFPAVVTLQRAGEPIHTGLPWVDKRRFASLSTEVIDALLADGYEPGPVRPSEVALARGARRVMAWPAGQPDGMPLRGLDSCVTVEGTTRWHVERAGSVLLRGAGGISWEWEDGFGFGIGRAGRSIAETDRVILHLAEGPAELRLTTARQAELCQ